jgi:hypothetical protein
MEHYQHTNHNEEYLDGKVVFTKHELNVLYIGASILVFLFLLFIGIFINWNAFLSTIGMFTFFWCWKFASYLSTIISFTESTAKIVLKSIVYIACVIVMAGSIIYELLFMLGQ